MAIRQVVKIDEDLCNGCGDCVPSCAEGAIQIIDGKARLVADNLCDGLGACLGDCPMGAITVEEREADQFDEAAVEQHMAKIKPAAIISDGIPAAAVQMAHGHGHSHGHGPGAGHGHGPGGGCPGSRTINFADAPGDGGAPIVAGTQASALRQWPVQMHLVNPMAPYFQGADVLFAADCCAFAIGGFHSNHLAGKSLAIACPKLDQGTDIYVDKLVTMIDQAKINTLTVMIMEVPCCAGLVQIAQQAAARATRKVPVKKVVVGLRGEILGEDWI